MLAAGLADPRNHYLVNTTFFDSPAGPVLLGMLHLHADTVTELAIEDERFICSVLLDPRDRRQRSPVRVGFAKVWQVVVGDSPVIDLEEAEDAGGILYDAPQVLRAYLRTQQ